MVNSIEDVRVLDTRGSGHDALSAKAKAILIVRRIVAYTVLVLLSFICSFTLYVLIIKSTKSHSEIQTGFSFLPGTSFGDNWQKMLDSPLPVINGMINSFLIAFASALLSCYFSALTAYGIHMYQFKRKRIAFLFIILVMMVPSQVSAIGLVMMCQDMGLISPSSGALAYIPLIVHAIASPIVFFYIKQYLDSILPKEMVEAARVDGAGELRIFHGMVLPILKPALAIQFIFSFVSSWNNYFVPQLILANTSNDLKTIPLALAILNDQSNTQTFDLGRVYMVMLLARVPLLIVYLVFSNFILKNLTSGAVKG
jgi:multiple sugar transport system permease protein